MNIYQALLGIAERHGIHVAERTFPAAGVDFNGLYVHLKGFNLILINKDKPQEKKNFVLAHELAHYQLHRDILDMAFYNSNRYYRDFVEDEADRFAYRLLGFLSMRLERGREHV